jgi:sugar lactone lactonase YvrE
MKTHVFYLFIAIQFLSNVVYCQTITTIAGCGTCTSLGDGGPATLARLYGPSSVVVDSKGNLYIGDGPSHRVRKVDLSTNIITTIAGTGISGYNGDSIQATSAQLSGPTCLAVDKKDNLYIGDSYNNRIRRVDAITGQITTFAGNGVLGSTGDMGLATLASIAGGCMVFDKFNNMYFGDYNRIRKVDTFGIITTVAGNGMPGVTVDGMLASGTRIGGPTDICMDNTMNIFIADSTLSIRKISSTSGIISRVGGTGDGIGSPYCGDGNPATLCNFIPFCPRVFGKSIYNAGYGNQRIHLIDTLGIIRTVAGTGTAGFSGDGGLATVAKLNFPKGIAFDACGNLYIADFLNYRIRKVTMPPTLTIPSISLSVAESGTVMPVGSTVTVNATVANAGSSYMIRWQNRGVEFATTTVPVVTYTKMPGVDTITARVVSTASYGCYDSTTSSPQYVSDSSTGVRGVGVMGGVYVYPNPANKQVTIMAGERMHSVAISNMQGQELLRYTPDATSYTMTIDMLPPGVYVVRVNNVWVGKVVKE